MVDAVRYRTYARARSFAYDSPCARSSVCVCALFVRVSVLFSLVVTVSLCACLLVVTVTNISVFLSPRKFASVGASFAGNDVIVVSLGAEENISP